ncbi:hypothetical protein JQ595_03135 [Bradyrhizobium japonicum]|uniref:hypothetical protein n=1 Tax=Bradyrhizobium japonicum TaxID=375 RepID=UPI001BA5AFB3|nr:hypothetical protein [Bradyrhizobium japonicum]MBR0727734.1 hypothetical protein [Bradyrhizobium japonicum]
MPQKSGSDFDQLVARNSQLCVGSICEQVDVGNRLIELARREVIAPAFDPIVEMIAGRQRRLQQLAAEEFVNEQRRDVALPGRRIVRRPLAGSRQRPCLAQRALNLIGIEAHRHLAGSAPKYQFRIIRLLLFATVLPDVSNGFVAGLSHNSIHSSLRA